MVEATSQVQNLRERGKKYYFSGKADRDAGALEMSVRLFKRGALYPLSTGVSVDELLKVSKNYLASVKLLQEVRREHDGVEKFDHDAFFDTFATVKQVHHGICHMVSDEYDTQWRNGVAQCYFDIVRAAVAALALVRASDWRDVECRTKTRVACLERLLNMSDENETGMLAIIRYELMQVLLKASITLNESNEQRAALSFILQCETHYPFLQEAMYTMDVSDRTFQGWLRITHDDVESLKSQVYYQRCICESSSKIAVGEELLEYTIMNSDESLSNFDDGTILLSIDAFKEAQVLARETSLLQEAHATGRLGYIFRVMPSLRNPEKSNVYYLHSFKLLESERNCLQAVKLTEWGRDVVSQRERIQREMAEKNDQRKAPILEKNKDILEQLKRNLGIECSCRNDIADALMFLYDKYPPSTANGNEDKLKVKAKLDKLEYSSAIRTSISQFHPDRNREDKVGFERHVMCEEITKMINLMYSKLMKDI